MTATTDVEPKLRSTEMSLMYEALARAQHSQRVAEAEWERLALRPSVPPAALRAGWGSGRAGSSGRGIDRC